MSKAGGIVALIAGIFGFIFALFTLSIGGVASGLHVHGAGQALLIGWIALIMAALQITFGAIAVGKVGKRTGFYLLAVSLIGIFAGLMMVASIGGAICSLLALLGGILVEADARQRAKLTVAAVVA
jgi:hypothetical protein